MISLTAFSCNASVSNSSVKRSRGFNRQLVWRGLIYLRCFRPNEKHNTTCKLILMCLQCNMIIISRAAEQACERAEFQFAVQALFWGQLLSSYKEMAQAYLSSACVCPQVLKIKQICQTVFSCCSLCVFERCAGM